MAPRERIFTNKAFISAIIVALIPVEGLAKTIGQNSVKPTHCSENCTKIAQAALTQSFDRQEWNYWVDTNKDCKNTRAEILIRDSLIPVTFRHKNPCMVDQGIWYGPYTGNIFTLARELDTEHIVPVKNAHYSGGANWPLELKQKFANDMENIIVVDRTENLIKGNNGPDRYRPPKLEYHCEYAYRWRDIKLKYNLTIAPVEEKALQEMEATCNLIITSKKY